MAVFFFCQSLKVTNKIYEKKNVNNSNLHSHLVSKSSRDKETLMLKVNSRLQNSVAAGGENSLSQC